MRIIDLRMVDVGIGRNASECELLRERVASLATDWPTVGFLRIDPAPGELRLRIASHGFTPAWLVALALKRAIRREGIVR